MALPASAAASVLFLGSLAVLAAAGLAALLSNETLLFPSLGPTAMLFFARPLPPENSVGSTIVAHWIGILVGLGCLLAFGLREAGPAVVKGVTPSRIVAAALSVAVTAAILRLIRAPHAPAGATTLIVSLGVLTTATQLVMMAASVVLVAVLGWALNLLVGVRVPWWPSRRSTEGNEVGEQMPVPWRPAAAASGDATRLFPLPQGRSSEGSPPPT
ncbi:MAG TPA: HPP family protein [Frankiaceae bacterium]|nr:HPP family protein [Frankiaceae bacterium]